ncbi:hypothetical protein [Candidatus Leptofilum sp.]|uniref:hypothetical protein n=1 Tax=Candidatus Leptofilum sp. TaxID=3241576 RepID=UPI003B5C49EF
MVKEIEAVYSEEGYCIVRHAVDENKIKTLQQLIAPIQKRKRKVHLLGQPMIVEAVHQVVKPIFSNIGITVDKLEELYLLVAKTSQLVKLGWHRDAKVGNGIHSFQLPLLPGDNIHQIVPGTHLREINEAEILARNAGGKDMPNAIRIDLAAGDILLRSPFLFHRGYSVQGVERLTFVGTYSELTLGD